MLLFSYGGLPCWLASDILPPAGDNGTRGRVKDVLQSSVIGILSIRKMADIRKSKLFSNKIFLPLQHLVVDVRGLLASFSQFVNLLLVRGPTEILLKNASHTHLSTQLPLSEVSTEIHCSIRATCLISSGMSWREPLL